MVLNEPSVEYDTSKQRACLSTLRWTTNKQPVLRKYQRGNQIGHLQYFYRNLQAARNFFPTVLCRY